MWTREHSLSIGADIRGHQNLIGIGPLLARPKMSARQCPRRSDSPALHKSPMNHAQPAGLIIAGMRRERPFQPTCNKLGDLFPAGFVANVVAAVGKLLKGRNVAVVVVNPQVLSLR